MEKLTARTQKPSVELISLQETEDGQESSSVEECGLPGCFSGEYFMNIIVITKVVCCVLTFSYLKLG